MATKKVKPVQVARKSDCVTAMEGLKGKVDLLIADPPYNFGQKYDSCKDSKSYNDYLIWTQGWMATAQDTLKATGSMWVFCPDEWVSEIDIYARKTLGMYKRRHVIWAFTFGQSAQKNFTRSHCHLLWLTMHKTKYTFNKKAVQVPSARQLVYDDKRAVKAGKSPDATWMLLKDQLEPYMTPDKDTWLMSRICGTFKERKNHSPNQLPVPLLERIVLACSNKGNLVIDPFSGTGSSGVACAKHGRNWQGFDISQRCVTEGNRRIKEALQL